MTLRVGLKCRCLGPSVIRALIFLFLEPKETLKAAKEIKIINHITHSYYKSKKKISRIQPHLINANFFNTLDQKNDIV